MSSPRISLTLKCHIPSYSCWSSSSIGGGGRGGGGERSRMTRRVLQRRTVLLHLHFSSPSTFHWSLLFRSQSHSAYDIATTFACHPSLLHHPHLRALTHVDECAYTFSTTTTKSVLSIVNPKINDDDFRCESIVLIITEFPFGNSIQLECPPACHTDDCARPVPILSANFLPHH